MMNKTVVELRVMAKELGIKNYSKMNKAALVEAVKQIRALHGVTEIEETYYTQAQAIFEEENANSYDDYNESYECEEPVQTELPVVTKEATAFVNKYKTFKLYDNLRGFAPYVNQLNLAKAIENNFDITINTKKYHTAGELSDVLAELLNKIESGVLVARPTQEVEQLVKAYKPATITKQVTSASKAQLDFINKLEKETGVTNKKIVSDVKVANEIIQQYLVIKRNAVKSEVAVTTNTTIQEKLSNPTFRTKFTAMMKRIFA